MEEPGGRNVGGLLLLYWGGTKKGAVKEMNFIMRTVGWRITERQSVGEEYSGQRK